MAYKHILVPLDGSAFAEMALKDALSLAQAYQSKISLVRVVEPPHLLSAQLALESAAAFLELGTLLAQEAQEYLAQKQQALQSEGYEVGTLVMEGDVIANQILTAAEQIGADVIVMSTHGRSGIQRWVFGSVAERVLHHAALPVLLVRVKTGGTDSAEFLPPAPAA